MNPKGGAAKNRLTGRRNPSPAQSFILPHCKAECELSTMDKGSTGQARDCQTGSMRNTTLLDRKAV
jgi:hypothetical protein